MRVLMIAISSYDFDPRIIRLSTALLQENIQVELICLRYENQPRYEVKNGVHVHRIMKSFHQDSIQSYTLNSSLFLISAVFKCLSIAAKNQIDLVHVHNMPDHLVYASIFQKIKGIPIILDIHDLTLEMFKEKWSEEKFNRFKPVLKVAEKMSCGFADQVLTVTSECVDILAARGIPKGKIALVMNSADENIFTYDDYRFTKRGEDRFRILYHGTIAKRFGLHCFIRAMPEIVKAIPSAEFHLYGNSQNNEYADQLKMMSSALGLDQYVFVHGKIPYAEVNDLIRDFDLGVVPYEQTEYMNLAMPTKACEYALTGLPFIISDLSSVRSVFSDESVRFVDPDNASAISQVVIDLYHDPKKRRHMSLHARADARRISWDVMKKRYIDLVRKLTGTA